MRLPERRRADIALLVVVLAILGWSAVEPHDRFTWLLEVAPVLAGLPVVIVLWARFPLTPLLLTFLALHAVILMVGGHYTYAEVPLGEWMRGWFGFSRNHYDRIGHFAQGFVPALLVREILARTGPFRGGGSGWLVVVPIACALAFSAFYELIEWWVAAATGTAAEAFLGTQGDPWDTQWDMFLALVGAITSMTLLARLHDRQLAGLRGT